jgi:TonB family protein
MSVRVSFLMAMMAIGSAGAFGQSGAVGSDSGHVADATNNAPVGSEERPALVSGGVMTGRLLHKENPAYPEDAKENHVSGMVVMEATIDREGKIATLKVISGPEVLRGSTLEAVRKWTYKPFQLNGAAVFVKTTISVNFSMTR